MKPIRISKMHKLRFIEFVPSRVFLVVNYSAIGTKGEGHSLSKFSRWANGTHELSVSIRGTISFWYSRTKQEIPENSIRQLPVIPSLPAIGPTHLGAK